MADDLYEMDFYTWTQRQADHLRERRFDLVDLANVVEEIETLERAEASALRSAYRLIALHLLKMIVQPGKATKSWRTTIIRERNNAATIIAENPGLEARRADLFAQAYRTARKEPAAETCFSRARFPEASPFALDQAEDDDSGRIPGRSYFAALSISASSAARLLGVTGPISL